MDPITRVPLTSDVVLPVRSQEGWIRRDNIHRQASLVEGRTRFGCGELRFSTQISIIKLLLLSSRSDSAGNSRIEIEGLSNSDEPVKVWSGFTWIPPHPGSYNSALYASTSTHVIEAVRCAAAVWLLIYMTSPGLSIIGMYGLLPIDGTSSLN